MYGIIVPMIDIEKMFDFRVCISPGRIEYGFQNRSSLWLLLWYYRDCTWNTYI